MTSFTSPFSSGETFDDYDEFVPEHIPRPGDALASHELLCADDHVAFHQLTRELFEERGVYDMTFNYNLARLNLDTRHPSAGYRYAVDADDPTTLWAEFTPTTPFCPQSHTLTIGSFRAWNGLSDRHDYELVRVRVAMMHHRAGDINAELADLETRYLDSGDLGTVDDGSKAASDVGVGGGKSAPF